MSPLLLTAVLAAAVLGVLAIIGGWILGWANRAFAVEVDQRVAAIGAALPGANCGGCGYVGCNDYAEAVAAGKAELTLCGPGGSACATAIAAVMGQELGQTWPYKAVVHCGATREQRLQQSPYHGEQTCQAANLVSGVQGCTFGCLGFGDCAAVCPYDAIDIYQGLAVVDQDKCTGCKKCAKVCPRNIISIIPFKADAILILACSNTDKGKDVKAVCSTGCLGCSACEKVNKDLITMKNNLPVINYEIYDPAKVRHEELIALNEKCPMERFSFVGRKPTAKELELIVEETLPERVEADFHTTVDKTEWRG